MPLHESAPDVNHFAFGNVVGHVEQLTDSRQFRFAQIVKRARSQWNEDDVVDGRPAEVAHDAAVRSSRDVLQSEDAEERVIEERKVSR